MADAGDQAGKIQDESRVLWVAESKAALKTKV